MSSECLWIYALLQVHMAVYSVRVFCANLSSTTPSWPLVAMEHMPQLVMPATSLKLTCIQS